MSILRKIIQRADSNFWNIGFIEEPMQSVLKKDTFNIKWLKHNYTDRWFADPYILDYNEKKIIVLVEEFNYRLNKGRIAKLIIDRPSYTLREMKIILEETTHLSFPVIIRSHGRIFIMPENSSSGAMRIYNYDPATDKVTLAQIVCNLPLTDATIVSINKDESFILSTAIPTQNGSDLSVYKFNMETFEMDEKPFQTIHFDNNRARNAGDVFFCDGSYYRPAQDCNGGYGRGVYIQKLNYCDGKFTFNDVMYYTTNSHIYDMGYHTFNQYKDLIVIDAHGHRFPVLHKSLNILRNIKQMFR